MKTITSLLLIMFMTSCISTTIKTKKIKFEKPNKNKYKKTIMIVSRNPNSKIKCFNNSSGEPKIMRGFYMTKDTLSHYNVLEADYDYLNKQIDIYTGMDLLIEKPSKTNQWLLYSVFFLSGIIITGAGFIITN